MPFSFRTGKKKSTEPPHKRCMFARYAKAVVLPSAPAIVDYSGFPGLTNMLWNDILGCCVISAMFHLVMLWAWFTRGVKLVPTRDEFIAAYSAIGGYVDGDPSTDNGCDPYVALQYWQTTGITVGGLLHKIGGWANVNVFNSIEVKISAWLFGGHFVGWQLPSAVLQDGVTSWAVPPGGLAANPADPDNGHMTDIISVDAAGNLGISTWGAKYPATPAFLPDYVAPGECFVIIPEDGQDWIGPTGKCPAGFDLPALLADRAAL